MKPSRKPYAISIKSDSSKGSRKSHSSKNSQKNHLSRRSSNHSHDKSISNKSKSSGKSSIKSISKEQAELIKIQTEERVNRKLKLLEKRKQLEFEIAKDEVYEELLEAQNQLEIAELLEKKELENIKTEYQEEVNKKLSISKSKSLESSYSEDIGALNTTVKNKTLQIPSNLLENCQLPTHSTKTTTKVRKPSKLVSKDCINSSILREAKFDHNEKTKTEPVDRFIDLLIEGEETILPRENSVTLTIANAVQQEIESRHLPPVDLKTFSGDPSQWPEFIENFKTRVHTKPTFNDTMRMERLISVLRGEVKREIESIGTNSMFYATALKTLKREYGNPLLVSHLKLKKLFDQPQIKNQDRTALREYQHQLKCSNIGFFQWVIMTQ